MDIHPPPQDQILDTLSWLRNEIYPNVVGHDLDDVGIAAWLVDYYTIRYRIGLGLDHQAAKEKLFDDIYYTVHPDRRPSTPPPAQRPAFGGRLTASGKSFVDVHGQVYRGLWGSCLTALSPTANPWPLIDEYVSLGFTGIRVFAGALTWANQLPADVLQKLPGLLDGCLKRGLYVEVTALTDSGTGYDPYQHVRAVAAICQQYPNALLELANEYYHSTQCDRVHDVNYLRTLYRQTKGMPTALSAAEIDELPSPTSDYPTAGGDYITVHLARNTKPTTGNAMWWFEEVCRIREMAAIADRHNVPVVNNEPNKGILRPGYWLLMGAVSRGFELGATCFHTQNGLMSQTLDEKTRPCAEAFVKGFQALDTTERLTYKGSHYPVEDAAWYDPNQGSKVWRAYGFLTGDRGYLVVSGLPGQNWQEGNLKFVDGWTPGEVVASEPGVVILRVSR